MSRRRVVESIPTVKAPTVTYKSCAIPTVTSVRHAYGEKLRVEAEQKERIKHHNQYHKGMVEQLDQIQAQLNALKKIHNNMYNTYGMSHNAAKYFQKQDEEYARLRQKVDQFAETRSKELTRHAQRAKHYHELLKDKDKKAKTERQKSRDISNLMRCRREPSLSRGSVLNNSLLSSSSSPSTTNTITTTTTPTNSQGSSSTILISSCSSPISSTDEHLLNIDSNNSHLVKTSHTPFKTPPSSMPLMQIDLQDEDTLEVTDVNFFSKIEDQTMIEVNKMMNRLKSTLEDLHAV